MWRTPTRPRENDITQSYGDGVLTRAGNVTSQDVAITEDGRQYRIDLVQSVDEVYPPSVDLTLSKVEQEFKAENFAEDEP